MKGFLAGIIFVILASVLLVAGVDNTLNRMGRAPSENSFTWYDDKGNVVLAYRGEQSLTQRFTRPPSFLHRT